MVVTVGAAVEGKVCTATEVAGAALAAAVPAIAAPVASAALAKPVAHAFFVLAEIVMKYNLSWRRVSDVA